MNKRSLLSIGLCLVFATACGDDDESNDDDQQMFADPDAEQLYVLHYTNTAADGTQTSFINTVSSLNADVTIDQSNALELSGYLVLETTDEIPETFFAARTNSPVVERYEITSEGGVERTGTLNLGGLGASYATFSLSVFHFESATRAFMMQDETLNVVVWNPSTMEIIETVDLSSELAAPEGTSTAIFEAREDQGRFVVMAGYRRPAPDNTHIPLSRVAFVDLNTLDTSIDEQSSCGYLLYSFLAPDGFLYYASHPNQASIVAAGVGGDPTSPHCMVRVQSGSTEFDASFFLDLNEILGRPIAAVIPGGEDGRVFATAYPEDGEQFNGANRFDLRISPVWEFYDFELGDAEATIRPLEGTPVTTDQVFASVVPVDNENGTAVDTPFLHVLPTDGFSGVDLYNATDPNNWVPQARVPGFLYKVRRVR
ncbi:MAG: hypothetical protein AAFQ65_05495 [Myxococcota bacterium]